MKNILSALMVSSLVFLFGCQAATSSSEAKTEKVNEAASKDKEPTSDKKTSDSTKVDDGHDHAAEDEAKRISLADAKAAFDKGEAFFIDTRSANAYENEHIKGAVNIRSSQVEDRYKDIPKDKTIIVYCSWPNENTSARVVLALKKKGIKNAAALIGGTAAWKNAGHPMARGSSE